MRTLPLLLQVVQLAIAHVAGWPPGCTSACSKTGCQPLPQAGDHPGCGRLRAVPFQQHIEPLSSLPLKSREGAPTSPAGRRRAGGG